RRPASGLPGAARDPGAALRRRSARPPRRPRRTDAASPPPDPRPLGGARVVGHPNAHGRGARADAGRPPRLRRPALPFGARDGAGGAGPALRPLRRRRSGEPGGPRGDGPRLQHGLGRARRRLPSPDRRRLPGGPAPPRSGRSMKILILYETVYP